MLLTHAAHTKAHVHPPSPSCPLPPPFQPHLRSPQQALAMPLTCAAHSKALAMPLTCAAHSKALAMLVHLAHRPLLGLQASGALHLARKEGVC